MYLVKAAVQYAPLLPEPEPEPEPQPQPQPGANLLVNPGFED